MLEEPALIAATRASCTCWTFCLEIMNLGSSCLGEDIAGEDIWVPEMSWPLESEGLDPDNDSDALPPGAE